MTQRVEPTPPFPKQQQAPKGSEALMQPKPKSENTNYKGSDKLKGKVAIITGGDSGIGRAVAILFAREGADIGIIYLDQHQDAQETKTLVEKEGGKCEIYSGDVGNEQFSTVTVEKMVKKFGHIDILVNNAAEQHVKQSIEEISAEQLQRTFQTNVFGYFFLAKAVTPHLQKGSAIINTTSVTAYRGSAHLLDYSATKGAIVAFTRSLSQMLASKGIRVNGVAPGPIWTPLIVSTFPAEESAQFGSDTPLGRPGQPEEVAPCYVFLASQDSSYMSGQILHPNGGEIING
jgi:NAD(P)-dependent dehydrogenase (short-subunit alcohol dehydrogenase family)